MTTTANFAKQKEAASKTLGIMLDYLGLDAQMKIEENKERMVITISSEDAGRIIGRKGQTLDSLQLILNRMMFKADNEFPRIVIDIDGYTRNKPQRRTRRPNSRRSGGRNSKNNDILVKQAIDAAKEVKRWGEAVTLPMMNAHDRRLIHITLQDDNEIVTQSHGEGNKKSVVISLNKND
ncbi:R3H domain-containing nucleic acid-binding protein [Lentisphaerota bacterium WC36G]|nr:KH domain-containing protein [Lentisphaerae bacterium WC36]